MVEYILSFDSNKTTLVNAGGKGMNLAVLARAGFPVPPGFIITTTAYREFVETNRIQAQLLELAKNISPNDLGSLENISAEIRSLFEAGQIPAKIAADISNAYRELSGFPAVIPVAVRSSATAEDLPGLAFAGQQDTYLNVLGESQLLDAVKRCWSSLWSGRAMAYRERSHIPPEEVALAVVVQKMIPSESAGVMFTANPVTGNRSEMVIDASFGLGEAVVSGQVEPDHYEVDPSTWQITRLTLGSKKLAILPLTGGGVQSVPREAAQEQQVLQDLQVITLAQAGYRVAEHFGAPQDIEWAWEGGEFYLLQSRPITSLYPLPDESTDGEQFHLYINFNTIQGVPDPLTPLGRDALRLLVGGTTRFFNVNRPAREFLPDAGDRLFLDVTGLASDSRLRSFLFTLLSQVDPASLPVVRRLIDEGIVPTRHTLTLKGVFPLVRSAWPILSQAFRSFISPAGVYPRAIDSAEKYLEDVERHIQNATGLADRLQAMEEDLPKAAKEVSMVAMPAVLPISGMLPLVQRWLTQWLGREPGAALRLLRGLSGNLTTQMDLKLWSVAQAVRGDPEVQQASLEGSIQVLDEKYRKGVLTDATQDAIDNFLQEYGMRSVAEIDLGRPRWREDPGPVLEMLLGYLQIKSPDQAPDAVFMRNRLQAERLVDETLTDLKKLPFGGLRSRLVGGILRRMRLLSGLREVPLFYMVKALGLYRSALLEDAGQLVRNGDLECPEDVFFVPFDVLKRYARGEELSLKEIVTTERGEYQRELFRRQLPHVLLSTGEAFYEGISAEAPDGDTLAGEPVSPGLVEGRVRVVFDPRGARLEPGEILVCQATDPGWTPLFLTAGGLVMETGGMISHGSVVAREYGLPAVAGVHNATGLLKTGERVRVDGSLGRITVLPV